MLTQCCGCRLRTPSDPTVARYNVTFPSMSGVVPGGNYGRRYWRESSLPTYYTAAATFGEKVWSNYWGAILGQGPDPGTDSAPELRHLWTDEYGSWFWGGVHIATGWLSGAAEAMHLWLWFPPDGRSPVVSLLVAYDYALSYMSAGVPIYLPHHPVYTNNLWSIGEPIGSHWSCSRRVTISDETHPHCRYPFGDGMGIPDPADVVLTMTATGEGAPYDGTHILTYFGCVQRTGTTMSLEQHWQAEVPFGGGGTAIWNLMLGREDIDNTDAAQYPFGSKLYRYIVGAGGPVNVRAVYYSGTGWAAVAPGSSFSFSYSPSDRLAPEWRCIGTRPIYALTPLDNTDDQAIGVERVD